MRPQDVVLPKPAEGDLIHVRASDLRQMSLGELLGLMTTAGLDTSAIEEKGQALYALVNNAIGVVDMATA